MQRSRIVLTLFLLFVIYFVPVMALFYYSEIPIGQQTFDSLSGYIDDKLSRAIIGKLTLHR